MNFIIHLKTVLSIAYITFKEGVRHRLLLGGFIFALLLVFLAVLGSGLFMRDILKVQLDICLSAISLSGLLVPLFYTINQLSGDIERKSIYSILSRNVSRDTYILGKFVGISFLTFSLISILFFATLFSLAISQYIYPDYFFSSLSFFPIFLSIISIFLSTTLLNCSAIFWCTATTSSFLATLLTLGTYAIGQTIDDLVRFALLHSEEMNISQFTVRFLEIIMYTFPNFAIFDMKQYASHGDAIPINEFLFITGYSFIFITILLIISISIFTRRDI